MKNFLESNLFLIALLVVSLSYLISFISTDVVMSDKVYQKFLDEKYETKYNEYKELDVDLSEFEELKEWSDTDRWLVCSEGRPKLMTWWRLDPL